LIDIAERFIPNHTKYAFVNFVEFLLWTIIKRNSLLITIPEWLFDKILAESKKELSAYYQKEKHQSFISEMTLSDKMFFLKEKVITESIPGTEPEQDYP